MGCTVRNNIVTSEVEQWSRMIGEVTDEVVIEIGEAEEGLNLFLTSWCRPLRNSSDLHRVHLYRVKGYDNSDILDL